MNFIKKLPSGFIILVLFLMCLLAYHNSFHNEFLMDDFPILIGNSSIGTMDFWHLHLESLKIMAYFRPVTHFMNFMTFVFFGTKPEGYHLVSFILYFFSAVALYFLILEIFQRKKVAFFTSVIYCVHPINSICVDYKNATAYPFMILSMILSLLNFIQWQKVDKKICRESIFALVWFVIALLCHESAAGLPLYGAAYLFFIKKDSIGKIFKKCLPFFLILFAYILFRASFVDSHLLQNIEGTKIPLSAFGAVYAKLCGWYLKNLIFPASVVLMYSATIPYSGLWVWNAALLLSVFFLGIIFWDHKKWPQASLAFSWIVIGLLMVAPGIFSRIYLGYLIQPHWLFFASIGAFMLYGLFFDWLGKYLNKTLYALVLIFVLLFFVLFTNRYNFLWGKQRRYCEYILTVDPQSFIGKFWLAYSEMNDRQFEKAKQAFLSLVPRKAYRAEIMGNLGCIEYHLKNYDTALRYLLESLRENPNVPDSQYYFGLILMEKGRLAEAEKAFKRSVRLDPYLLNARRKLAEVYFLEEKYSQSKQQYQKVLEIIPDDAEALANLKKLQQKKQAE